MVTLNRQDWWNQLGGGGGGIHPIFGGQTSDQNGNQMPIRIAPSSTPMMVNAPASYGTTGPGPNPSWTRNSAGQYNFNGNSGFGDQATGFGSLLDEEALWVSKYGQPAPGVSTQPGSVALSNPAPISIAPPPIVTPTSTPTETAVANAVAPTPTGLPASALTPAGYTNGAPADPYQKIIDSLTGVGTNAYGPGGTDQSGTGPPRSVGGLQAIQPQVVRGQASSSGGTAKNPIVIILFLLAAGFGVWYYMKHHHKKVGTSE